MGVINVTDIIKFYSYSWPFVIGTVSVILFYGVYVIRPKLLKFDIYEEIILRILPQVGNDVTSIETKISESVDNIKTIEAKIIVLDEAAASLKTKLKEFEHVHAESFNVLVSNLGETSHIIASFIEQSPGQVGKYSDQHKKVNKFKKTSIAHEEEDEDEDEVEDDVEDEVEDENMDMTKSLLNDDEYEDEVEKFFKMMQLKKKRQKSVDQVVKRVKSAPSSTSKKRGLISRY